MLTLWPTIMQEAHRCTSYIVPCHTLKISVFAVLPNNDPLLLDYMASGENQSANNPNRFDIAIAHQLYIHPSPASLTHIKDME